MIEKRKQVRNNDMRKRVKVQKQDYERQGGKKYEEEKEAALRIKKNSKNREKKKYLAEDRKIKRDTGES